MTPKISLVVALAGSALAFAVPAAWGEGGPAVGNYPDAVERAVNAQHASVVSGYVDAHGRIAAGREQDGLAVASSYPDAFERALRTEAGARVLSDGHDRLERTSTPAVGPVSSGNDLEWPQLGIGFAVGILIVLGLGMALRLTRTRQLAH